MVGAKVCELGSFKWANGWSSLEALHVRVRSIQSWVGASGTLYRVSLIGYRKLVKSWPLPTSGLHVCIWGTFLWAQPLWIQGRGALGDLFSGHTRICILFIQLRTYGWHITYSSDWRQSSIINEQKWLCKALTIIVWQAVVGDVEGDAGSAGWLMVAIADWSGVAVWFNHIKTLEFLLNIVPLLLVIR